MRKLSAILLLAFLTFGIAPAAFSQVTVAPFLTSNPQFLDGSGSPLASGCVFTYAAGTTTPLVTYSDSAGSTPNSNPVILNSGGFPQAGGIWLTSAAYKFVVKSNGGTNCSTGSTITTTDGITWATAATTFAGIVSTADVTLQQSTAATSGANQSSNNLKIQAKYWNGSASATESCNLQDVLGTGANPTVAFTLTCSGSSGATTFSVVPNTAFSGSVAVAGPAIFGGGVPWFDVTSGVFNAKCDGVTDDTTAIQAALTAAPLIGGVVFIPDGKTCVVATNSSPALNLDQALNVGILCGVAGGKSRPGGGLTKVCQLKFTGTPAVALSARSSFGVVINGVALTASNAAFSGTIIDTSHVSIQDTQNFGLLNSTVTGTSTSCSIGVSLDKAIDSNVTNSHFFGCTAQVKGASASGSYSNNNKIRDNDFNGGTGVAAFIRNPGKTTDISANTFELNTGANLIDFSGSFADCGGTSVEKNLIDDLSGTPTFTMISVPCSAFSVNKNNFQIADANATAIAVSDNVANFSAKGNAFCAGTFATLFALGTADVVDIREDACSFTVTNFLTGTPAAGSQVVDNTARTTNYGAVAMPTSLQVGAGTTFTGSVGTGTSIASNSAVQTFVQACSGTATAGTTLALQWAGGACTSSATALQAPTSTAGTLLNLRVKCGTGGVNASSGVFTLEKNGANATTLTCTMGTGTACADTTHTVAAAAGDTWQMFFTTQGAETLANCAASWEKQ